MPDEKNDTDRELDADLGEQDAPEVPTDAEPVPTEWVPTADDDLVDDNA